MIQKRKKIVTEMSFPLKNVKKKILFIKVCHTIKLVNIYR